MEKEGSSQFCHSPKGSRPTKKMGYTTYKKSMDKEYELRLEGLKSSIITVYGDALDKIGFSITEKANRSAQTRLGKTLKSLEKMENKEDILYRKQKYELQQKLDRLHQQQINTKREYMKKASSLDDLDYIDGLYRGTYNSEKHNKSMKSAPKSFRLLGRDTYNSCEHLEAIPNNKHHSIVSSNIINDTEISGHTTGIIRPASATYPKETEGKDILRPATTCVLHSGLRQMDDYVSHTETKEEHPNRLPNKTKPLFPKLDSKAHFLVQTPKRGNHLSKTPDPPRKNIEHATGNDSSDNDFSPPATRKFIPTYNNSEWLPPTKEEMLQVLEHQKTVLQFRVNAFLEKQNPK